MIAGIGGALAVVALVLVVVVGQRLRGSKTTTSETTATDVTPEPAVPDETPLPAPPVPGQGLLVLDALPWAEVVAVVDRDGKPQALGATRYTPAVLHLPEGSYTISLKHPLFGQQRVTVDVRSGGTSQKVVELGRVDPRQYLKEAGF
jgi:hypothetical protein